MRVLFAAPDRDLIRCYETLLAGPDRTVETAFDGVQVLRLLSEGDWDLLILSRDIPRIDWRRIVEHRSLEGPPILLLSAETPDLRFLRDKALPHACLPLPFLPEELEAILRRLLAALNSEAVMELEGRELPISSFRLGKARLILSEVEALAALTAGRQPPDDRTALRSLNEKLAAQGFAHRIRYRAKEGYRLVTEDE